MWASDRGILASITYLGGSLPSAVIRLLSHGIFIYVMWFILVPFFWNMDFREDWPQWIKPYMTRQPHLFQFRTMALTAIAAGFIGITAAWDWLMLTMNLLRNQVETDSEEWLLEYMEFVIAVSNQHGYHVPGYDDTTGEEMKNGDIPIHLIERIKSVYSEYYN